MTNRDGRPQPENPLSKRLDELDSFWLQLRGCCRIYASGAVGKESRRRADIAGCAGAASLQQVRQQAAYCRFGGENGAGACRDAGRLAYRAARRAYAGRSMIRRGRNGGPKDGERQLPKTNERHQGRSRSSREVERGSACTVLC
jgi:hypothetical protein